MSKCCLNNAFPAGSTGSGADATKLPLVGGTLSGALLFSGTTHAGIRLNSLTTTQRDALTPGAGDFLFNFTLSQFQGYTGAAWQSMAGLTSNTFTGQQIISTNGAASTPPLLLNGTIFTGGSATTTKPQFLIEPTGTTSTGWKTTGTMFGANAPTGFAGDLFSGQVAAVTKVRIDYVGNIQWDATDNTVSIGRQGNGVQFCADGVFTSKLTSTELRLTSAQACVWTDGTAYAGATVTSLRQSTGASVGSPCLQLGADAAGVTNQHFKACNRITSNGVGANLTLSGGNGRGGAGGDLILASYTTEGSGVAGTLTTRWKLNAATGELLPGANATYSLGNSGAVLANVFATDYYSGSTKVVGPQGAAVTDASGGAIIDAEARTALNDLLARVRAHGLIAT